VPSILDEFRREEETYKSELHPAPYLRIGLVIFTVLLGIVVYSFIPSGSVKILDGPGGTGPVQVTINPGASLTEIGKVLADAGVVKNYIEFVSAAEDIPQSSAIGPGKYNLVKSMGAKEAIFALLDPESKVSIKVVIPEGSRSSYVFAAAARALGVSIGDFESLAKDPKDLGLPEYAKNNVEGFLYPATYRFDEGITPKQVLQEMIKRFLQAAQEQQLEATAKANGLKPYDVIIIASIIEKEVAPIDQPKAAQTILNRLAKPMRLQLDSTLNYELNSNTIILTSEQLQQDSAYNTYTNDGLPPGPISNPSEAAINAVLNPEEGDWLYWVTVNLDTKETKFSTNNDQFLKDKQEFLRWYSQNQ
jgi:UPF0755 protein